MATRKQSLRRQCSSRTQIFVLSVLISLLGSSAHATIVYDNTAHYQNFRSSTTSQTGDEILLAGSERVVTEIQIGVTMGGSTGTADFQARIYANDGPQGEPHTKLWQSEIVTNVSISGDYQLLTFSIPNVVVPDIITWTIQNYNSSPIICSVPFFDSPTIGSSPDYGWWGLDPPTMKSTNPDPPVNLMARVHAIPEPTSLLLLTLGSLGLTRRKSNLTKF